MERIINYRYKLLKWKMIKQTTSLYFISIILMSIFISNNPYVVDYDFSQVLQFLIGSAIILGVTHKFYFRIFKLNFEKNVVSKGLLYSSVFGAITMFVLIIISYFSHEYTLNNDLDNYNYKQGLFLLLTFVVNVISIVIYAIVDLKTYKFKYKFILILRASSFYFINYIICWMNFFILLFIIFPVFS